MATLTKLITITGAITSDLTDTYAYPLDDGGDSSGTVIAATAAEILSGATKTKSYVVSVTCDEASELVGPWIVGLGSISGYEPFAEVAFIAGEDVYRASGGTSDTDEIITGVLAGLDSLTITRIGAEYDPETATVTLIQGDDYLGARGLSFSLTGTGLDLATCSVVFGTGAAEFLPLLTGTATLSDIDGGDAMLILTWTREQTNKPASCKYAWGAVIIDADDQVQTVIRGPLVLTAAAVLPATVTAVIEAG